MKKIILSLSAVLFSSVSFSQDTTGFTAPTSFVIEADSMSAKQITSNYLNWVALNFKSANDVGASFTMVSFEPIAITP